MRFTALLLACCLWLTGCSAVPMTWKMGKEIVASGNTTVLSDAEMRIIALAYKKECEGCYAGLLGDGFWLMEAGDGITYEEYIKEYFIWKECKALIYLNTYAADMDITIGSIEEETITKAAREFYGSLTESEKSYIQAGLSDIKEVLRKYYKADKVVSALISEKNIEISDEESRVMDVDVIHVNSQEDAEDIYRRVSNGENFASLAKENTLDDTITYTVSRETLLPDVSSVLFSLSEGDISDIFCINSNYYIFRISTVYDTLLSSKNKLNLLAERRFACWEEIYDLYEAKETIKRNQAFWSELSLKESIELSDADLFEMFDE